MCHCSHKIMCVCVCMCLCLLCVCVLTPKVWSVCLNVKIKTRNNHQNIVFFFLSFSFLSLSLSLSFFTHTFFLCFFYPLLLSYSLVVLFERNKKKCIYFINKATFMFKIGLILLIKYICKECKRIYCITKMDVTT